MRIHGLVQASAGVFLIVESLVALREGVAEHVIRSRLAGCGISSVDMRGNEQSFVEPAV